MQSEKEQMNQFNLILDDLLTLGIKKWIHVRSCLSTWLQQWFGCFCSVMLAADCSWTGNVPDMTRLQLFANNVFVTWSSVMLLTSLEVTTGE